VADDFLEFAQRLQAAVVPPVHDLEDIADRTGFDSWRRDPTPIDHTEASGLVDARSGYSVQLTDFEDAEFPPHQYPKNWIHIPNEHSSLLTINGPDGPREWMLWSMAEDPQRIWDAIHSELPPPRYCQGPYPSAPVGDPMARRIREAKAFWRHPNHDAYRTLVWYDITQPEETTSIVFSAWTGYSARPNEEL
jgi:hypothetical protein